jgi:uncharacterized protein (TIGR03089 family)
VPTFAELLDSERRRDGARPFVTWYDEATGERVELSVTTYANWVAKTASLLVDEHGLERGHVVRLDLPTHWLWAVFLGAAWTAGLAIAPDGAEPHDAVVTGPGGLERWAPYAAHPTDPVPVLACSLLPMGVRFASALPTGVHDVGVEVWSQPDAFLPYDPPTKDDVALLRGGHATTQDELWGTAAVGSLLTDGGRLLVAASPASPPEIAAITEPLARRGSVVLVVGPDVPADRVNGLAQAERVTSIAQPTRS